MTVLALSLPALYDHFPAFQFWLKFALYYTWLMFSSLIIIPLSLIRPGSVDNAKLGARLMRPVSTLFGIDWTMSGNVELLSMKNACVIVCNHQSSVDLLGMFHIWDMVDRMAVIAKQSLAFYGTFGKTNKDLSDSPLMLLICRNHRLSLWNGIYRQKQHSASHGENKLCRQDPGYQPGQAVGLPRGDEEQRQDSPAPAFQERRLPCGPQLRTSDCTSRLE